MCGGGRSNAGCESSAVQLDGGVEPRLADAASRRRVRRADDDLVLTAGTAQRSSPLVVPRRPRPSPAVRRFVAGTVERRHGARLHGGRGGAVVMAPGTTRRRAVAGEASGRADVARAAYLPVQQVHLEDGKVHKRRRHRSVSRADRRALSQLRTCPFIRSAPPVR